MRKMPSAFVTAENRKFVSGCTRLKRTLGITEPLGSVTLPVIVPVSNCASAKPAREIQTDTTTLRLRNDIFPPFDPVTSIYTLPSAVSTGLRLVKPTGGYNYDTFAADPH